MTEDFLLKVIADEEECILVNDGVEELLLPDDESNFTIDEDCLETDALGECLPSGEAENMVGSSSDLLPDIADDFLLETGVVDFLPDVMIGEDGLLEVGVVDLLPDLIDFPLDVMAEVDSLLDFLPDLTEADVPLFLPGILT